MTAHHALFLLVMLAVTTRDALADLVVSTTKGDVAGKAEAGAEVWLNVPFGKPPTPENGLRFRAPVEAESWDGVLDATQATLGDACPQFDVLGKYFGTEDCLKLHIYRPANTAADAKLPVMVWIYGGAYVFGDGEEFGMYNGTALATKHNVIVVTPNYRLDTFGFLAIEALQRADPHNSTGNMALQDQRLAMQWVQENIGNFGGDPSLVTIFGESAGGFSMCHHLSNGNFPDLFSGVIMESGSCQSPEFFLQREQAFRLGDTYVDIIGCNHTLGDDDLLSCLDGKSTADLMAGVLKTLFVYSPFHLGRQGVRTAAAEHLSELTALRESHPAGYFPTLSPVFPFGPVVDGTAVGLPKVPLDSIHAGEHVKVPVLLGTNKDEGTIFVPLVEFVVPNVSFPLSQDDLEQVLHWIIDPVTGGKDFQVILDAYPSEDFKSQDDRCAHAIRDYIFACPARRAARGLAAQGQDAFLYQFVYPGHSVPMRIFGDFHSSELLFVWDHGIGYGGTAYKPHYFDEDDQKMSDTFQLFWTNFAKLRTPNGDYTDGSCSWNDQFGTGKGFCAPSVLCLYQPRFGDASKDDSCRLVSDWSNATWPSYSQSTDQHMVLDEQTSIGSHLIQSTCDVWDDFLESY